MYLQTVTCSERRDTLLIVCLKLNAAVCSGFRCHIELMMAAYFNVLDLEYRDHVICHVKRSLGCRLGALVLETLRPATSLNLTCI